MVVCKTCSEHDGRISQGDIYRNVHFIEGVEEQVDEIVVKRILFPYVMVLTQDCDLQQDHNVRWPGENPKDETKQRSKRLLSVLVAPLYNAEQFFAGTHLDKLLLGENPLTMIPFGKKDSERRTIVQNNHPRYHYFEFGDDLQLVNLVLDFKHYFSVSVESLGKKKDDFICRIAELYREHACQRFSHFLSRIGLPDPVDAVAQG